jgi:DNA polymerase III delta subunit
VASVVLVLGPERFLARRAVAEVLAAHPDLETTRYAGAETRLSEVLDDVRTPTLFGKPRAVVVEDAGALFEAETLPVLADYAERPVAGSLLVLQATSLDGRLKEAKRLKAAAEVIDCKPLQAHAVAGWIGQHARTAHGLTAGADAIRALRERLGDDLGQIDAALARLKAQIAPRTRLEGRDVAGSTEDHRSPILFEAGNALEARDLRKGLQALSGAFREGIRINQDVVTDWPAVAPILLTNLHRTYVKLLRFHMLARGQGLSDEEAARESGVSPRAARYFVQRARAHRLDTLLERHRHFVEADVALKSASGLTPRQILERLLVDLLK